MLGIPAKYHYPSRRDSVGGVQCQKTRWNQVRDTGCSALSYQNPCAWGEPMLPKFPADQVQGTLVAHALLLSALLDKGCVADAATCTCRHHHVVLSDLI